MDIIQHSFIWNRCVNRLLLGKEQKMKCGNCSHAEMCKWIDELEGRGCDFYDDKPCELLILKSDILLHQDDRKRWAESIKQEKAKGLIILPPYFTPVLVPDDVEIQIEQEPCEDAISREAVIELIERGVGNKSVTIDGFTFGKSLMLYHVKQLPSVTHKSGVEPQESEE